MRTLPQPAIDRLTQFRISRRLTLEQLKLTMGIPVKWPTLKRALLGFPIHEETYQQIAAWCRKNIPAQEEAVDRKSVAAGCSDRSVDVH